MMHLRSKRLAMPSIGTLERFEYPEHIDAGQGKRVGATVVYAEAERASSISL